MSIQIVKDSNGKEFSVDLSKIRDINGDIENGLSSSLSDSKKNRLAVVRDIEYVDEKGKTIDSMKLLKDMANKKVTVYALDVEMEATHSGKNHNYTIYYEDSMEKDAESFLNPFQKPMLKNHDDYRGEPLGRIRNSLFGPSSLTDERGAIHLTARVTDKDAIPKFLDGRYRTVSIGGSMGTVTCNVCGKTILKDGKFNFCGHWRGETYKDQVCYWGARDIEYHEVSTVNNPADDFAQILKVTVVTDNEQSNDNNKKEGAGEMSDANKATKTTVNTADFRNKIVDLIDDLLETSSEVEDTAAGGKNIEDSGAENKDDTTKATENIQDTKAEGEDEAEDALETLKKDLEDSKASVEDLTNKLNDANTENEKLQTEKDEAIQDAKAMKDQCVNLAVLNKEFVADRVVELEIQKGTITDAQKEERTKELVSKSMKELNGVFDGLKIGGTTNTSTRTTAAKVDNPTLANVGENNAVVVKDGKEVEVKNKTTDSKKANDTNNEKPLNTVDDFAKQIVGKLFK